MNWKKLLSIDAWLPIFAMLLAIVASALIMLVAGYNPIEAFRVIIIGAFGNLFGVSNTLAQATPIMLTGLAYALARKASIINLGIEGQLYMGALAAILVGRANLNMPAVLHVTVAIIAGILAGGLTGAFAGFLKVSFGANEVISTIMLNTIIVLFIGYLVSGPLMEASGVIPQTDKIMVSAELPRIFPKYQLNIGLGFAILACIVVSIFLSRSVMGYEINCVGKNRLASETAGIPVGWVLLFTMFLSGAIGGLAGSVQVLGVSKRLIAGLSPGYGFTGIAVAALAAGNPIGVIISGIIFGALISGTAALNLKTAIPTEFVDVIQSMVVIFVAAPMLVRSILQIDRKGGKRSHASHH